MLGAQPLEFIGKCRVVGREIEALAPLNLVSRRCAAMTIERSAVERLRGD